MRFLSTFFILCCIVTFSNAQNIVPFNIRQFSNPIKRAAVITRTPQNTSHQGIETVGEKCLQKQHESYLMEHNPQFAAGRASANELTARMIDEIETGERATPTVYTIPIVFHVIHKGESVGTGTNISDAQVQSCIDALNRDYRRTTADGGIGQGAGPDTEIQFCLAAVNPSGQPSSGINRVNGASVSGYSASGITSSNESAVKALSRWDNRYYLNIWVVSEIDDNGADLANPSNWTGGTLGYAYQPTNPVTWNADLDGVVAVNLCVGNDPNQNQGFRLWPWGGLRDRTLTHEIGHFLNLNHTFDGNSCSESNCNTQGDLVCDTPPTAQGSTCSSPSCPNTQVENYMDYTEETCQNMFSNGQTTRMRAVLAGVRNDLVTTNNCGATTDWDASISAIANPSGTVCQTDFIPEVTLTNSGSSTLTSVQIQYFVDSNAPNSYSWSGNLGSNSSVPVTLATSTAALGAHTFTAKTVSGTLNGSNTDQTTNNDQSTSSFNTTDCNGQVCDTLAYFNGSGFVVNSTDLPNFGFEVIDNDQQPVATTLSDAGYTSNWMGFYELPAPGDTNYFVRVTSWFADNQQPADDWLTFGPVTIPSEGGNVYWNHRFPDNSYRDGYSVLVNLTGTSIADFNAAPILYSVGDNDASTDGDTTWTARTVNLPASTYAGQSVYIGFHHTALDMFFLDLDEIMVDGCASIPVGLQSPSTFRLNVYPNPSQGNFTLQYYGASDPSLNFILVNMLGQPVWEYRASGTSEGVHAINTDGLTSGVYTLSVNGQNVNRSEMLVLVR